MASNRSSKAALQRSLQQTSIPMYLVTADFRIAWVNPATARWTGLEEESLTELTCVWQSASDHPPSRQIANGLCPPPDCLNGVPCEFSAYIPLNDGQPEFRSAMACPLAGDPASILVIVFGPARSQPTEPRPAVGENREQRTSLHAAIAGMQYETSLGINLELVTGQTAQAEKIRRQIEVAGQTGARLMITGPPGSGRRQIAELVHFAKGPAMVGPLIPIDCNTVDAEGFQAVIRDLFRQKQMNPDEPLGRLLLLDVDRLGAAARQELGGFLVLPDFDLPVMATAGPHSSQEMDSLVWQKLSTVVIDLAPLADRLEDIPYLAQAILEQGNSQGDTQFAGIEGTALDYLQEYPWPGELAELIAAIQESRERATPPLIRLEDLPSHIRISVRAEAADSDSLAEAISLDEFLAEAELELIQGAVRQSGGNKSRAARLLGISRARLIRRLAEVSGTVTESGSELPESGSELPESGTAEESA